MSRLFLVFIVLNILQSSYAFEEPTCSNSGTTLMFVNSTAIDLDVVNKSFSRISKIVEPPSKLKQIDSKSKVDVTFAYNQKPGFADRVSAQWDKLKAIGFSDRDVSQFLLSPNSKLDLPPEIQAEAIRQKVEDDIAWETSGLDANELVTAKVGALLQGLLQSGKKVIAVTQGNGQKPFQDAYNSIINYGDNPDQNSNAYGSFVGAYYIQPYTSGTLSNGAEYPVWLEKDFLGKLNSVNTTHYYVGDTFSDFVSMDIVDDYLGSSDLIGSYSEIEQLSMSDWFVFGLNKIAHKMSPNCGCLASDGTSLKVRRHFNKLPKYQDGKIVYTYFGGGYIQDEGFDQPIVSENAYIESDSFVCGGSQISSLVRIYNSEIRNSTLLHPIGDQDLNLDYMFEQLGQSGIDAISSIVLSSEIEDSRIEGNFKIDESKVYESTYTSVGGFTKGDILAMNLDLVDEKSTITSHIPSLKITKSANVNLGTFSGKLYLDQVDLNRVTTKDSTKILCSNTILDGEICDPVDFVGIIIGSTKISDSELYLERTTSYNHSGTMIVGNASTVSGVELHNSHVNLNGISANGASFIAKGSNLSAGIKVASGSTVRLTSFETFDYEKSDFALHLSGSFIAAPSVDLEGNKRFPSIAFTGRTGDATSDNIYISGTSTLLGSSISTQYNEIPDFTPLTLVDLAMTNSSLTARGTLSGTVITNSTVALLSQNTFGTDVIITNKSSVYNSSLANDTVVDFSSVTSSKIEGSSAKIQNESSVSRSTISGSSVTIDHSSVAGKINEEESPGSIISGGSVTIKDSTVRSNSEISGSGTTISGGSIIDESKVSGSGITIDFSKIALGADVTEDKANNYCDPTNVNAPETKIIEEELFYNICFKPVADPLNGVPWISESDYPNYQAQL